MQPRRPDSFELTPGEDEDEFSPGLGQPISHFEPIEQQQGMYSPPPTGRQTVPTLAAQARVSAESAEWLVSWRNPHTSRMEQLGNLSIDAGPRDLVLKFRKPGHYELTPLNSLGAPTRQIPFVQEISADHEILQSLREQAVVVGAPVPAVGFSPELLAWIKEQQQAQDARLAAERAELKAQRELLQQQTQALAEQQMALNTLSQERGVEVITKLVDKDQARQEHLADREAKRMDDTQTNLMSFMQAQLNMMESARKAESDRLQAEVKRLELESKERIAALEAAAKAEAARLQAEAKERETNRKAELDEKKNALEREAAFRASLLEREAERNQTFLASLTQLHMAKAEAASPAGQIGQLKELQELLEGLGGGKGEETLAQTVAGIFKEVLVTAREVVKARTGGMGDDDDGEDEGPPGYPQQLQAPPLVQQLQQQQQQPKQGGYPFLPGGPFQHPVAGQQVVQQQQPQAQPQAQQQVQYAPQYTPQQAQQQPQQLAPAKPSGLLRNAVQRMAQAPRAQWPGIVMETILQSPEGILRLVQQAGSVRNALAGAGASDRMIQVVIRGLQSDPIAAPFLGSITLE